MNTKPVLEKVTYTLPSYWASYLINGDSSGISDKDKAECDSFIARMELPAPVDCSTESWFSWHNDATDLGGDVMEYTFLIPSK